MGYDLRRGADGISVSIHTWPRAYALAIEGGWTPQGTLPNPHLLEGAEFWPGSYYDTEGQVITAEDAQAMAGALDIMLSRLPPEPGDDAIMNDYQALASSQIDAVTYFSLAGKRRILQALIQFLRGGECQIW